MAYLQGLIDGSTPIAKAAHVDCTAFFARKKY
jgi:hypothetical protein